MRYESSLVSFVSYKATAGVNFNQYVFLQIRQYILHVQIERIRCQLQCLMTLYSCMADFEYGRE